MPEFRDCTYWPDYAVSNEGEVVDKRSGQILKQYPQKSGYVNVWLNRGNGNTSVPVHRLVCTAFHGEEGYIKGLLVDHIDTNRTNNNASNLHWVDAKGNANNPNTIENRKRINESKRNQTNIE